MKVLILAGGFGTRLSEETGIRPKPMVEIGEKPILWHIMKHYHSHGFNEFVILLGYKGEYIKDYFYNYYRSQSSFTIDLEKNEIHQLKSSVEPWKVTLLDTGANSLTGGRLLRAKEVVGNERFMLTYGDGVSDIDISRLISSHIESGKIATMSAVQPEGRFGTLEFNNNHVVGFKEKIKGDGGWINGGFFVLEPEIFNYLKSGDQTIFEREPLENLAKDGQLNSFKHNGFWKCMDTLADKNALNEMWNNNSAKWKIW